ncbi:MAG: hypothetical protein ABW110_12100 [Steroidobacteraceae bacterium]
MQATISPLQKLRVNLIGFLHRHEQIDILGSSDDTVGGQRKSTNQRKLGVDSAKYRGGFCDLPA